MASKRIALILGKEQNNEQAKNGISPALDNMDILTYTNVGDFITRSVDLDQLYDHIIIHEHLLGSERGPITDAENDSRVETIRNLENYISGGRDETKIVLICRNDKDYRSGVDLLFVEEMGNPNVTPVILSSIRIPLLVEFIKEDIATIRAKYYSIEKDSVKVGIPGSDKEDAGKKSSRGGRSRRRGRKAVEKAEETAPEEVHADGEKDVVTDDQGREINGEYFNNEFRGLEFYDEEGRLVPVAYDEEGNWYPTGRYEGDVLIHLVYSEGTAYPLGYVDEQGRYVAGAYGEDGEWYALGEYNANGEWVEVGATPELVVEQVHQGIAEVEDNPSFEIEETEPSDDGWNVPVSRVEAVENHVQENDEWSQVGGGSGATGFLDEEEIEETPNVVQEHADVSEEGFTEASWGEVAGGSGATGFLDEDEEPNTLDVQVSKPDFDEVIQGTVTPEPGIETSSDFGGFTEVSSFDAEIPVATISTDGGVDFDPFPEIPLPLETTHPNSAPVRETTLPVTINTAKAVSRELPKTTSKITVVAGVNSAQVAYKMAKVASGNVLLVDAEAGVNGTIEELPSRLRFFGSAKGIANGKVYNVDGFDFLSNGLKTNLGMHDFEWLSDNSNYSKYDTVIIHVGWNGLFLAEMLKDNGAAILILVESDESSLIEFVSELSDRTKVNDDVADVIWNHAEFSHHGVVNNSVLAELKSVVVVDRYDWLKKVS